MIIVLLCEGSSQLYGTPARQVDYLLFSHLLKQHGNEGADKAGRLAVVPFESFNGSYTPEAKVLKPALCPPALETGAGRSSGVERHELRLALTHSRLQTQTVLALMEESAQPALSLRLTYISIVH